MMNKIPIIKALLLLLITVCCSTRAFTQSDNYVLTGQITDQAGTPVNGASLSLLRQDSSVILAGFSSAGKFEFNVPGNNIIILRVVAIGFKSRYINVNNNPYRPRVDMETIKLESDTRSLRQIEVTGKASPFKIVDGNLSINIENTILSSSNTVSELLSKTPGVSVSDDNISVVGKGDAIIFYNGERIPKERLQALQVSQIKQIEVITNPSSRYDAEGKAVINIIGKKKSEDGLQGKVRQNFSHGDFFYSGTDISLDYKQNAFMISGGFNFQTGSSNVQRLSEFKVDNDTSGYYRKTLYNSRTHSKYIPTYRLGINYHLDSLSTISLEYNGNKTVLDKRIDNYNNTKYIATGIKQDYISNNNTRVDYGSNTVSLNYNRELDSKGSNLFAGAQFFDQVYHSDGDILQSDSSSVQSHFLNTWYNRIRLFSVRTDLEKRLNNGGKLVAGIKFSQASTVSDIDFSEQYAGEWKNVDTMGRNFRFKENIPAMYIEFAGKLKSFKYNAGLRTEMSIVRGYSGINRQLVIDTNYLNLFPYFKISRQSGKYQYTLSYATRLHRPGYDDLDPFTEYHDPTEVLKGNPYLKPTYTHSLEASLSFNDYLFKVGYMRSRNEISPFLPIYLDSGRIEIQKFNLNLSNAVYLNITVPVKTKYWESQNTLNISYKKLNDDRFPDRKDAPFPLFYFSTYHTFYIPNVFNVEFLGEYNSKQSDGFITSYYTLWSELGISRRFLQQKLNVRLSANDIFNAFYQSGSNAYANRENRYEKRFSTRLIRLSLTYSFGKLKSADYKNVGAAKEEINRAR